MFTNERFINFGIALVGVILLLVISNKVKENFENLTGKTVQVQIGEDPPTFLKTKVVGYTKQPGCKKPKKLNQIPTCVDPNPNTSSRLCNDIQDKDEDCYKIVADNGGEIFYGNQKLKVID